jgi:hypothetical protein
LSGGSALQRHDGLPEMLYCSDKAPGRRSPKAAISRLMDCIRC